MAEKALSLWQGLEMISVDYCLGEFVLPNQTAGWRRPVAAVPSDLAVLAALSEAERQDLLQRVAKAAVCVARARADYYERDEFVILNMTVESQYSAVVVSVIAADGGDRVAWPMSCGGLTRRWDKHGLGEAGRALLHICPVLVPTLAQGA